ncbi:MAG TPA: polysaccharide biosynthesis/export family protein [Caulobacteraceae bacterium]|nr:polysaccharide biosynthesis/export family protein [Caulobacteraceae bacterium]
MPSLPPLRIFSLAAACGAALAVAGCMGASSEPFSPAPKPTAAFPNIGYATWDNDEPDYRFYPGDQIELRVPSAPELNKTLVVQPDGRVSAPLIGPVMVADRSTQQVEAALTQAYASQLIRPQVEVTLTAATPLKVFVGGEVDKPGVYDMPGPIDALQAVIEAGGFKTSAQRDKVVLIRRGTGGQAMMKMIDLRRGASDPSEVDAAPLRRFDVVYVPRTSVSEVGLWMQQYMRDALPIQFSYAFYKPF